MSLTPTEDLPDLVLLAVALGLGVAATVLSVLSDDTDTAALLAPAVAALALRGLRSHGRKP